MDKIDPLNISLLIMTPNVYSRLMEVSSRDIFEQNSTEFHHSGLFSTQVFGEVGSTARFQQFGYIDTGLKVIHPKIYKELISLSSLYKGIIDGNKYVVFDTKLKDFVLSNEVDGHTGFTYFIKHYEELEFKETESTERKAKITLLKKYSLKEVLLDKYIVIPAGLRDYTLTESGKPLENEINGFYRKILTTATVARSFKKEDSSGKFVNNVRARVQHAVNELYLFIEDMLGGKFGYIQNKWTKRAISYGTRNVITSIPNDVLDVEDFDRPTSLSTIIGVLQAVKGILPIALFQVRTKFLYDIFDPESSNANLIDLKTFKRTSVTLSEKDRSKWVTDDGLEDSIGKLIQDDIKNAPIIINGHALLIVYDKDNEIRIINDVSTSGGLDTKYMRPITYGELYYLSIFDTISEYPGYITRYPITGLGSVVPAIPYLKSTLKSRKVKLYLRGSDTPVTAPEYPIVGTKYYNSLSIPLIYLDGLGGDFDGDKVSLNIVWKEESKQEVRELMNSRRFFIKPNNTMMFSAETLTNMIIMKDFTE